jgi:uncharacterized protein (DUF2126 family)
LAIHVALNHVTSYRYDRRVSLSPQLVRLRPAPHCRTPIRSYSLRITPGGHYLNWQQDPQSNYVGRLVFPEKVRELRVEVDLVAEMSVYNPFDFFLEPSADTFPFRYEDWQLRELMPFLEREEATARFAEYLAAVTPAGRTVDFVVELNRKLREDVRYVIRLEHGVQTKEETLVKGSGSCRDSAWLLVQLLRHLGLAARFVSGYLIQLAPDVTPVDGPAGPERDFTDLHAWAEVYLPGAGWVGLDPTSGLLAGEGHLPLACSPEPRSAAPITGEVEECEAEFAHVMSVSRIHESPRVTRPYTDAQWQDVLALGEAVDRDLAALDVRLSMGGEPTFVSTEDRDGAEWNTEALGPTKRHLAAALLRRLKNRYARNGFLHFGQGKWYPGEPLPRWALGCYWRKDGEPAWYDPALFADEGVDYGFGPVEAERFARGLCGHLGITDTCLEPAHEDVFYYLWRERRLPGNVDPFDARLDDPLERERLRRVFTQGLDSVVGYALPLAPNHLAGGRRWRTGPWFLRDERMYLVPGDSPMGYRLPLDSLPWAEPADRVDGYERDPLEARGPLPPYTAMRLGRESARPRLQGRPGAEGRADEVRGRKGRSPERLESADWILRTALCVQPRHGILYVFMPPLHALEDYLDLLAALETTAAELGTPVLLEGYPPPPDPRLVGFQVTPDPGVIEVNVHPSAGWSELVERTTALYEDAHRTKLSTEKFMIDGRHGGTGGGNHFVLGGETPADSPFLRRPDLLRSLLSYWHNHPSLSYLFSGLFIGPTSQAPRVDEARHDSLYELEIAFAQVPGREAEPRPWLVDRLFRNLLVDATGNTHRAEFCIDKLFAPESVSGRRGLLEMRAFEMPPHARMSLSQQLLLRALVARFWRTPYEQTLVRWGTELHDRFMLPYFVWLDFEDVLEETARAGYALDPAWFAPHLEFRFPRHGEVTARGVRLELRHALEPWHVMGEEGAAGGTVRFVDSSLERAQVLVTGATGDRYVVTCNGRPLPLHPTGRNGEQVAGLRYRAWQPPSCLHPTIPVHTPLTFDIVDTWMERSLGGCQYHAMHPGGRSYDRLPVNAFEAESRRLSRFFKMGHTPGRLVAGVPARRREFPYTLDLRTP